MWTLKIKRSSFKISGVPVLGKETEERSIYVLGPRTMYNLFIDNYFKLSTYN